MGSRVIFLLKNLHQRDRIRGVYSRLSRFCCGVFTTVILFSASLYVGNKIAESVCNHKSSTNEVDICIRPAATNTHIGLSRFSA